MLGFSLPKILVLVALIAAVWYGFKLVSRRNQARVRRAREEAMRGKPAPAVEDMTKCPGCGTYVPAAGARNCGRQGCPYPG